ncbi:MAG: hypothetical protein JXR96_03405 [Deltaproteobacteria bacterium]|nr:hypothetical protein [Deltaproteobacteria bacterium]
MTQVCKFTWLALIWACLGACSGGGGEQAEDCGNGVCEPGKGETCESCVQDCECTGALACIDGVCRWPTPAACEGEPGFSDFSFIPTEILPWFEDLSLVGCFSLTGDEAMDMDCEPQGLSADYWAQLPEGLYLFVGYQDEDTAYDFAYTIGLHGGSAVEAAPVPYDMPGGGGPVDQYGFFRSVARCGTGAFASSVSCECDACLEPGFEPQTYRFQVYYFRSIHDPVACRDEQAAGADCVFHFNCARPNHCYRGVCGSTGNDPVCGDGDCEEGESEVICPVDCSGDGCLDCLSGCRGLPACCTGCGCLCEDACNGCW